MSNDTYAYLDSPALETIRATHRSNLSLLSDQASNFGPFNVPLHIQNQIKHEKASIDAINAELARRGITSSDPAPQADLATVINHYHGPVVHGNVQGPVIGTNNGTVKYDASTINFTTTIEQIEAISTNLTDEDLQDQTHMILIKLRAAHREQQKGDQAAAQKHLTKAQSLLAELPQDNVQAQQIRGLLQAPA